MFKERWPGLKKRAPLESAHHDIIVLGTVLAAFVLLIGNGTSLFREILRAHVFLGPGVRLAAVALTLNLALIFFSWRRYIDLQHETERRLEGERRAAIAASTDPVSGLLNRKGFADEAEELREIAESSGDLLLIVSLQLHRFRAVYDRHGYDIGDAMLRSLSETISDGTIEGAVVARMGGDEFAIATILDANGDRLEAEKKVDALLKLVTRPFEIESKMIQVGAFAGMASSPAAEVRVPDLLRRADIALDHAKTGRVARPIWFDAAMDRVSGWYKRRSQIILFFIGLFAAGALNVDTIAVTRSLISDPALRQAVVAHAAARTPRANAAFT